MVSKCKRLVLVGNLEIAPDVIRTRGPRIRNPVLYPSELRGHMTPLLQTTASLTAFYLLSFFAENGQTLNKQISRVSYVFRLRVTIFAIVVCVWLVSGCAASGNPLSISLYHPKTGVQRTCAARESASSSSRDSAALSGAVEMCAKQLEAHGFVRTDRPGP